MAEAGRRAAALPGGHVEGFADTFAALFRSVYADVTNGSMAERPAYATFADGHEEMLVGEAIAASAQRGGWVAVEE
jgi:predicted dehydrogenase